MYMWSEPSGASTRRASLAPYSRGTCNYCKGRRRPARTASGITHLASAAYSHEVITRPLPPPSSRRQQGLQN
eukprot:scaffold123582_cov63-Phaeocystis_antarctica.AAC.2